MTKEKDSAADSNRLDLDRKLNHRNSGSDKMSFDLHLCSITDFLMLKNSSFQKALCWKKMQHKTHVLVRNIDCLRDPHNAHDKIHTRLDVPHMDPHLMWD